MWSVGLILVLCVVLASLWSHPKSDAIRDDRDDRQCGGASTTAPTIRGLRLSNQGKDVLLFSKIGLYLRLADATGNRIDWLEENKASVQFYTNGLVASKGDTIDMKTPTPDSYATVSREHYVAMPPETSLVIDLNADVPIAAVRVGAVESTTAPEQRRLLVETSAQYTSIADATFTAGFVRGPTTAQATGPAFFAYPRTAGSTKRFQSASDAVDEGGLGTLGGAYTIECRFKSASVTSYRNLCDMNYNATNVGPRFEQTSENKAYWVWSANGNYTVSPPVSLSENVWYYVAFVMNNGLVSTYLDDAPTASDVPSKDGFPTAFGSARIGGGFSADRFFQGEISMLNVYKTALTAVEIRSNAARAILQQPGASAPTSHISASGIYEYAATPTGFATVARDTANPLLATATVVVNTPHSVFFPAGVTSTSLPPHYTTYTSLLWDVALPPLAFQTNVITISVPSMQEIANYWAAYVDLSMYQWSDGSEVTLASFPAKFGVVGPVFKPAYYATWMPFHAPLVMTPPGWRARYYFDDTLDFKWGYSVPTYANRIALCLDNDRTGGSPQYNWHAANGTTWRLWGYPNKNYTASERVLIGTFGVANVNNTPGVFKWTSLSWPSGRLFTHYMWQPSTYSSPGSYSCPPILGM